MGGGGTYRILVFGIAPLFGQGVEINLDRERETSLEHSPYLFGTLSLCDETFDKRMKVDFRFSQIERAARQFSQIFPKRF
jgi:hypothetical protein